MLHFLSLHINNLTEAVKMKVRLFADDTVIYNASDNSSQLQQDLASLKEWETSYSMELHPAKCEFIRFSRKRTKTATPS